MAEQRTARYVASVIVLGSLWGLTAPAHAQVSKDTQACITTFTKGVGKIAKAQGTAVRNCVKKFAAGQLVSMTPEACLLTDVSGKVNNATTGAVTSITAKCGAAGPFPFGVTPTSTAAPASAISEIDVVHSAVGTNLDTALVPNIAVAKCQSAIVTALWKCSDARRRSFFKCQKANLATGAIHDAASLQATCLGTGDDPQTDPTFQIASKCGTTMTTAIARSCNSVDLTVAVPACGASTVAGVTSCLAAKSACELCQLLNEVGGLARDCDRFDDGNGSNGTCGLECGDGIVQPGEPCDDGNQSAGDGCSSTCTVEPGWSCAGSPSVCAPTCGNGVVDAGEECDDHGNANGDGCSSTCTVESGWGCNGSPSVCSRNCGNGTIGSGEACDDGNGTGGDGCSSACQIEPGYTCAGQPSVCTFNCGNGTFQAGETCDDHNATSGDGCSSVCQIEPGWLCSGVPSTCTPICGDGLLRGGEACDDGNASSGDGCSFICQIESGFSCVGTPSNCVPICGDGFIRGAETCDDGNGASGDGCSALLCRQELGWSCAGQPSVCVRKCGDGNLDPQEECDDGNQTNGDGCNSNCQSEPGYACGGEPSLCVSTCGNGVLNAAEQCDDGNSASRDGCSASCKNESGWFCPSAGAACTPFEIFIDSPAHGIFTTAGSVTISGHYTTLLPGHVAVTINGVPASSVNQVARTFSTTVPLSGAAIFNPVVATLTNTDNGDDVHDRIVVIAGPSVADGTNSPQSVALRINDSGLDTLEPLVGQLAGGSLNLGALLPPGTVITDSCFINAIGCWGSARVTIANPPPSYSSLGFSADSKVNVVGANVTVNNIRIDVNIDGSGLVPSCGLRLTANSLLLSGDYAMQPLAGDPSNIDVNLASPVGVSFAGFNRTFTSGLCDAPIIGDIIQAILPDIEQLAVDGIKGFLADPDGAGPGDSPIADAIETVLAGISLTGPVGQSLGLMFDSPLFDVAEDNTGITFGSNARFRVSIGTGPGQCVPPPGAPNLTASYAPPSTFPTFGATTPVLHTPYGLGIELSSAAFNQLLRGQTECGLMRTSLTTIDVDGPGGAPPLAITSSLLALLAPEFGQLPANTPLRIDIAPTLAPIVTGNPGPNGELTELRIAHVAINIVDPATGTVWLGGAFDARLGMDLDFLPDGSGLAITLAEPAAADLLLSVIYNPLGTNEAQLEAVLPGVIRPLIPELAGALSGFPVPQFFGLSLHGVEVSRNGQFLSLFANLAP